MGWRKNWVKSAGSGPNQNQMWARPEATESGQQGGRANYDHVHDNAESCLLSKEGSLIELLVCAERKMCV